MSNSIPPGPNTGSRPIQPHPGSVRMEIKIVSTPTTHVGAPITSLNHGSTIWTLGTQFPNGLQRRVSTISHDIFLTGHPIMALFLTLTTIHLMTMPTDILITPLHTSRSATKLSQTFGTLNYIQFPKLSQFFPILSLDQFIVKLVLMLLVQLSNQMFPLTPHPTFGTRWSNNIVIIVF